MINPSAAAGGPGGSARPGEAPPRLPAMLKLLALCAVVVGALGAFRSIQDVTTAITADEHHQSELVQRELVQLHQVQQKKGVDHPLVRLPEKAVQGLAARVGDEAAARRGPTVTLALMNLVLCWLLATGSLGTLRGLPFGPSMWRWANLAQLPFTLLSLLVALVRSRQVWRAVSDAVGAALVQQQPDLAPQLSALLRGVLQTYQVLLCLWHGSLLLLFIITAAHIRASLPSAEDARRA